MDIRVALAFLLPVVLAPACSPSSSSSGGPSQQTPTPGAPPLLLQDCDPMVPTECGFPFPSSVWTVPDSTTATGVHIAFGATTLPIYQQPSTHVAATPFMTRDGFSASGSIMVVHLPNASTTGLADPDHIGDSITPTSPTLLMEADTGALVPHFSELDELPTTNDATRTFFIRPVVRLKDATRYIVAIRNVVDSTGTPLPVNPVFQALRDDSPSSDLSVAPRRALYADIMAKLTSAGVDTTKLQLAWDFSTASKGNTTDALVHMRDDALTVVGTQGPAYTITTVTDNPNSRIRRRLEGTMTVPLYLDMPDPGASVNFVNGVPTQNGTAQFPFLVQIPNSLVDAGTPGAIIQNGHGLFGSLNEGEDGYMADICNREGYVEIAVNLIGMAGEDVPYVENDVLAGDISSFTHVVDRLQQGFVNELLAMRMMMGAMATDPATIFNGKPTIDPTLRFYRGDSQGGISGGVYMAISTDVTRGLLGEPGAPYNMLLDRSVDFSGFFLILKGYYPRALDIQLGIDLIQQLWDRAEPGGYVSYISNEMLPNTPAHNILIHAAIGDHQVTPLGAHFIARTVGAQNLKTVNRELFGIVDADGGFSGNGMCEWDFGLPDAPLTNNPDDLGPDPHDTLRTFWQSQDMADQFFRTGIINQTCGSSGPCQAPPNWADGGVDPEPDAGTSLDASDDSAGADAATDAGSD